MRNWLSYKLNRVIAIIIAVSLMAVSLAVGLNATFAASVDNIRLEQKNNYNVVKVDGTAQLRIFGIISWSSSDRDIATVPQGKTNDTVTITGVKAGVVGIGGGNQAGNSVTRPYQIVDANKITGYDIPKDGIGFMENAGTKELDIDFYRSPAPAEGTAEAQIPAEKEANLQYIKDNTLSSQVEWRSLHPEIVKVEDGNLIGGQKGVTLLIGEFTDRWGVKQTIHYVFGVGVYPGVKDSALNDLLDAIDKGEKIIDEYNNGNPNGYDNGLIEDLQNAIEKGYDDIAGENESSYKPDADDINSIINQITDGKDGGNKEPEPPTDSMPTGVTGNILSAEKAGDTSTWIEIAQNGGYSLILRSYCVKPNSYFDSSGKTDYNISTLKTKIDSFYASLSESSGLRKYAVMSNATSRLGSGADTGYGMSFPLSGFQSMNGISVPSVNKPTETSDVMFPLSYQEAGNFCLNVSGSPSAAKSNYSLLKSQGDAHLTEWHLRTPFNKGLLEVYQVTSLYGSGIWDGGLHYDTPNYPVVANAWCEASYYENGGQGLGVRPAIWVDSNIFK